MTLPPLATASDVFAARGAAESLRVCHVVLSLDVGGLERVVADLVRRSAGKGTTAWVLCLERDGALADTARAEGTRVVALGKAPGFRPSLVAKLARRFKRERPDVVHTHQVGALCYAGPAARIAGVPIVVHTEHGKHYAQRARTRLLGRLSATWADRLFCVSGDVADEVRGCGVAPAEKVVTVPNGIDVDRYTAVPDAELRESLRLPAGVPVIGTVGRLSEVKRQDVLLRAFARVRATCPAARLLLVGDGPERENLKNLALELGVADATHFAGYRADPQAMLPLMSVFALTSRSEGMPLAVLEAWAARVPVVASAVGGLPEMLAGETRGWLFPSGNDEGLASVLHGVLSGAGTETAAKVDAAHRAVCEHYSLDRVVSDYHRHYLSVARSARLADRISTPLTLAGWGNVL